VDPTRSKSARDNTKAPDADPIDVYRHAPLFTALRDTKSFEGKCGVCEYHTLCGGSRARAYAATGNPLGSDPLCAYEPAHATHAA
jgi:MoaA/NifB/PqqE/SkfB family radical SAM enzyme